MGETQNVGHVIVHGDDYACGCGRRFPTFAEARDHMTVEHGWPDAIPEDVMRVLGSEAVHCVECEGWHHVDYHKRRRKAWHKRLLCRHTWDRNPTLSDFGPLDPMLVVYCRVSIYLGTKTCLDCGRTKKVYA